MAIRTYGTMAVDWEQRIDMDRLRRERLARVKERLAQSELGALLCFDMNNVRYITATHIGTWAQDKISRFTLLPQDDEPILWDFGSAARHHQLNCDWLVLTRVAGEHEVSGSDHRLAAQQAGILPDPPGVPRWLARVVKQHYLRHLSVHGFLAA